MVGYNGTGEVGRGPRVGQLCVHSRATGNGLAGLGSNMLSLAGA